MIISSLKIVTDWCRLIPVFRFTASSHPRSGLMGCISFSVISMSAYTLHGEPSAVKIAWTRGVALIIGIVSAVVINWVIWPFVARHELRKSLSFMMLNLGISYRSVVARFVLFVFGGRDCLLTEVTGTSTTMPIRSRQKRIWSGQRCRKRD